MPQLLLASRAALAGCGRYADFTLPRAGARNPAAPLRVSPDGAPRAGAHARAPGEWDSDDVLNPIVVPFRRQLLNLYSGFDGKTWPRDLPLRPTASIGKNKAGYSRRIPYLGRRLHCGQWIGHRAGRAAPLFLQGGRSPRNRVGEFLGRASWKRPAAGAGAGPARELG